MKMIVLVLVICGAFQFPLEMVECKLERFIEDQEIGERGPKLQKTQKNLEELDKLNQTTHEASKVPTSGNKIERPSVIMVEKLSKYERDHCPVTVTFEKYMAPEDWFQNYDSLFRTEVAKRMNNCEQLQNRRNKFLLDDIVRVSISPYVQDGHISVSVVVLDPLSPGKYVFILGSNFFKCFNEALTQYEEMVNSTAKGIYIGLPETGHLSQVHYTDFIPWIAVGGFLALIVFFIVRAWKRKRICCCFRDDSIQEHEQTLSPAFSLSHLGEVEKYAVLRRIYGLNEMFNITKSQEDLLSSLSKPGEEHEKESNAPRGNIRETSL